MFTQTNKTIFRAAIGLMLTFILIIMSIPAYAQTGFTKVTNYNDLPVNYVEIKWLDTDEATMTTSSSFVKGSFKYVPVLGTEETSYTNCVYYKGAINWGTANRTTTTDASVASKNLGSFTLKWSKKAVLPDGTQADVIMTCTPTFYAGKKPADAPATVYIPIMANATYLNGGVFSSPNNAFSQQQGIYATKLNVNIKIVNAGTSTPIDSKYSTTFLHFMDLDVLDNIVASGKTDAQRMAGTFSEGIGLVSGFQSKILMANGATMQTVDGNTKLRGTTSSGTSDGEGSGCTIVASPQGFTYIWYGSRACGATADGKSMGTSISPSSKVSVNATAGTGGTIEKPGGITYIVNGTTTYDYKPSQGYKVKSLTVDGTAVTLTDAQKKNGGTYTFAKLTETSSTTYDHTIDVQFEGPKVSYQWDGAHPDKAVPAGKTNMTPGSYTVDTTYKAGDKVAGTKDGKSGVWTFNGWDKTGTIQVYEDTVIKGTWSFTPNVSVTYEWDGPHPDKNVPASETGITSGSTYTVSDMYKTGDKVAGTKDGKSGVWTFNGWDKPDKFTINSDTVIKGTWSFTSNVNVTYRWTGDHPNKTVPAGQSNMTPGTTHTLDTTYTKGMKVIEPKDGVAGYWTFNGWDKTGNFTVNTDTVVSGTWTFTPYVNVTYEWEGTHPDKTVPAAQKNMTPGDQHTVDTTYKNGDEVVEPKDGKPGVWTFKGWDRNGIITVNNDTVIKGTWEFTPDVTVDYAWEGDHPNKTVPKGSTMRPGTAYDIDTTFKPGDTVREPKDNQDGIWTFQGWDQSGTINLTENTTIKGTWKFDPLWKITTDAVNGTIDDDIAGIPTGDSKTITYRPNDGYQLKELIVNGNSVDINEHPDTYAFTDINSDNSIRAVFERIPELSITKTSDSTDYNAGDEITYTIKVEQTNSGAEARDVVVTDLIPEQLELIEDSFESAAGGFKVKEQSGNAYTVSLGTVSDSPVTFTYKCISRETVDSHDLLNTATVSAGNNPEPRSDTNTVNTHVPQLELLKEVDKAECVRDEELTYTVTAKQTHANAELRNAVLTDDIPEGTHLVEGSVKLSGDSGNCKVNGNKIEVTVPALKDTVTVTYKLKVDAYKGNVPNTAILDGTISGTQKIPQPLTSSVNTIVNPPVMELKKEISESSPVYDDVVTYTITATQKTEGTYLTDALIEDSIPEGLEPADGNIEVIPKGTAEIKDGKLTARIAKIETNAVIKFKAKVKAETGSITNTAVLSSPEMDNKLEASVPLTVTPPVLEVTKEASEHEPTAGDEVSYKVESTVENLVAGILRDIVPDGLQIREDSVRTEGIDGAKTTVKGQEITVELPKEKTTGKLILEYIVKALHIGEYTNIVTLDGENNPEEPAKADETINVQNPELDIEKTVDNDRPFLNEIVTYTVTANIKNARSAVVADKLPSDLEYVEDSVSVTGIEGSEASFTDGVIVVSMPEEKTTGTAVITYKAKATALGEIENIAGLDAANNELESVNDDAVITVLPPELSIAKGASREQAYPGETIDYTVTAEVAGAQDAIIRDALPDPLILDKDSVHIEGLEPADVQIEDHEIIILLPEEHTTGTLVLTYTVTAGDFVGFCTNTANINASNFSDEMPEVTVDVEILAPTLKISKKVSRKEAYIGEVLTFTVNAEMEGLFEGRITDKLPEGLEVDKDSIRVSGIEGAKTELSENELIVQLPSKHVTGELELTYDAVVTGSTGSYINTAILDGANNTGDAVRADAPYDVIPSVILIEKEANRDKVQVGKSVRYTITAEFEGALNPSVTDVLPEGMELDEDSVRIKGVKDASADAEDGELNVTLGEGVITGQAVITYEAKAKKSGTHLNTATITAENIEDEEEAEAEVRATTGPVKTGDDVMVYLFGGVFVLAAALIAVLRKRVRN